MNIPAATFITVAMLAVSSLSQAAGPIYYTVNSGAIDTLHQTPITDTFTGDGTFQAGICNVPCTFTATGTLSDDLTGDVTLSVTDAHVTGNILCNSISYSGFPWIGSVPHPLVLSPMTFTMSSVNVSSPCGSCSHEIEITFDPANGGSLTFNGPVTPVGTCLLDSNLTTSNYYDFWH